MRKFKNINKYNYFYIWIICLIVLDIIIYNMFFNKFNTNVSYIAKVKIDELTRYSLNKTVKKHLNLKTNDYIIINYVNNKIVSISVDNNKCNLLLKSVINELENSIKLLEKGRINKYHNLELIRGNNGIAMFVPTGVVFNNAILSNLGPKIPIKVNFLENINAYLDVKVNNYGINNALIKLYIVIEIDEVLEIPIDYNNKKQKYKFLISSSLINGEVPDFLGGTIDSSSLIVKSGVN